MKNLQIWKKTKNKNTNKRSRWLTLVQCLQLRMPKHLFLSLRIVSMHPVCNMQTFQFVERILSFAKQREHSLALRAGNMEAILTGRRGTQALHPPCNIKGKPNSQSPPAEIRPSSCGFYKCLFPPLLTFKSIFDLNYGETLGLEPEEEWVTSNERTHLIYILSEIPVMALTFPAVLGRTLASIRWPKYAGEMDIFTFVLANFPSLRLDMLPWQVALIHSVWDAT